MIEISCDECQETVGYVKFVQGIIIYCPTCAKEEGEISDEACE